MTGRLQKFHIFGGGLPLTSSAPIFSLHVNRRKTNSLSSLKAPCLCARFDKLDGSCLFERRSGRNQLEVKWLNSNHSHGAIGILHRLSTVLSVPDCRNNSLIVGCATHTAAGWEGKTKMRAQKNKKQKRNPLMAQQKEKMNKIKQHLHTSPPRSEWISLLIL